MSIVCFQLCLCYKWLSIEKKCYLYYKNVLPFYYADIYSHMKGYILILLNLISKGNKCY